MKVFDELQKLKATAEASSDSESLHQIESIIEDNRFLTQKEIIALMDYRIKMFFDNA